MCIYIGLIKYGKHAQIASHVKTIRFVFACQARMAKLLFTIFDAC